MFIRNSSHRKVLKPNWSYEPTIALHGDIKLITQPTFLNLLSFWSNLLANWSGALVKVTITETQVILKKNVFHELNANLLYTNRDTCSINEVVPKLITPTNVLSCNHCEFNVILTFIPSWAFQSRSSSPLLSQSHWRRSGSRTVPGTRPPLSLIQMGHTARLVDREEYQQ